MNIELSIITINYNGLEDTCALIETIPFNDKMEVIVVDNASTKDEASEIEHRYPYVKLPTPIETLMHTSSAQYVAEQFFLARLQGEKEIDENTAKLKLTGVRLLPAKK